MSEDVILQNESDEEAGREWMSRYLQKLKTRRVKKQNHEKQKGEF
ncbi:MAG: hypothetical protein R2827_10255 [Bdellovibrionales bacterium]